MKKLVGQAICRESRIPPSVATTAIAIEIEYRGRGSGGEPLSGGGRSDDEGEYQQDADDLDRLGGSECKEQEDRDVDGAHRDSARFGDVRVDGREEEGPVDDRERSDHDGGDGGDRVQLVVVDADDASEEEVGGLGRVPLVEGEEEDAEAEPEREDGADRAVALASAERGDTECHADEQGAADHAEHRVDSDHECGGRAGEAQLRDRVHGETETAGDDERADRAASDRDDPTGDQGGVDEVLGEQLQQH